MLKGVKKGDVSKSDYRFEEKAKGYYKVIEKATKINRTMTKDKVEYLFGVIKEKKEVEIKVNIDDLLNNINLETFETNALSKEEKKAIKDECKALEITSVSYKDMIKELKELEE